MPSAALTMTLGCLMGICSVQRGLEQQQQGGLGTGKTDTEEGCVSNWTNYQDQPEPTLGPWPG